MHEDIGSAPWGEEVTSLAVEVLRALAEPTRLQIAGLLLDGERSVTDLTTALERPGPGISQHLAKMRMARLVATRRDGTVVYYRIENDHVRALVSDVVGHVEHLLDDLPAHHREGQS